MAILLNYIGKILRGISPGGDPLMPARLAGAAVLAGFILLASAFGAQAQEDTAQIVLKKKAARERPPVYVVQKGDSLSSIVRRKLGKRAAESPETYRLVKKLNPEIRDINRIHPGQKITLPHLTEEPAQGQYVVRKGDSLWSILRGRMKIPEAEMARWLASVKELNPALRDLNRLFPGQKLKLPGARKEEPPALAEPAPPKPEPQPFLAGERDLEIIAAVVRQAGGTIVRSGRYFIAIGEKESLAIDSAAVPVVELPDGSRALLDFQRHVPEPYVAAIRARWANYTVLHGGDEGGVFPVLEKIFAASSQYSFRRHGDFLEMGSAPLLKLMVDWVLERREGDGKPRLLSGVCRVSPGSQPIPAPVLQFAGKNGHTVLLVDEGEAGIAGYDAGQDSPEIPALDSAGHRVLVHSLLDALGVEYEADPKIVLFEERKDGQSLTMRSHFRVKTRQAAVVIHVGELPEQFKSKLREKGMTLVQVSPGDTTRAVIENTLKGLGVPYSEETDQFRPYDDGTPPRWVVVMSALKVQAKQGVVYLVPPDADAGLCGFIEKHWLRRCVRTGA